jgi:hypothetical protein
MTALVIAPPIIAAEPVLDAALAASSSSEDQPLQLASYVEEERGGFRIVPYGVFWSDMTYATRRTNPGSFTLFVLSEEVQGEPAFTLDARRSRFGIEVLGPSLATDDPLHTGGRLEIDFQGEFIVENRAEVLLRHAYWEASNDRQRVLIGQNWDIISPLLPRTVNYATGYNAGNIGFRRAQVRYDRYIAFSEELLLTVQGSLNQDIVADFAADPGVRRESADWPVLQARAAITVDPGKGRDSATWGVSGHIGETGFDFLETGPPPRSLPPQDDARFKTWSYNIDVAVPLSERIHLQAEFFQGANLSPQLGGIGQGICPCTRQTLRSIGGWFDLQYEWNSQVHTHVGYGIDDPRNEDLLFGRTLNQFLFVNLIYDLTSALSTGFEVTYWDTRYQETRGGLVPDAQLGPTAPGQAVIFECAVRYAF